MANQESPAHWITFYRKGNGGAHVHPAAERVRHDELISFRNITGCRATVKFNQDKVVEPDGFTIEQGASQTVKVIHDPHGKIEYRDYKVKLSCGMAFAEFADQYAEGGSDPGLIIEP